MFGNPRFGPLGLLAFPYFVALELLGPIIELVGFVFFPIAWAFGLVSFDFFLLFLIVSLLLGVLLSISALALEEFSFKRHIRHRDIIRLIFYSVIENFGYRQLVNIWRWLVFVDLARGRKDWGAMRRRGIGTSTAPGTSGKAPVAKIKQS